MLKFTDHKLDWLTRRKCKDAQKEYKSKFVCVRQYDSSGKAEQWPDLQNDNAARRTSANHRPGRGHFVLLVKYMYVQVCVSSLISVQQCERSLFVSSLPQVSQCDQPVDGPLWILHGAFLRQLSQPANQPSIVGHQEWHQAGPQRRGEEDPSGDKFILSFSMIFISLFKASIINVFIITKQCERGRL